MADDLSAQIGPDRTLLLVDDDEPFVKRLARAMEKRGFIPETAESVAEGKAMAQSGGVGIAASVHAEILRLQEAKSQPAVALAPHSSSLTTR